MPVYRLSILLVFVATIIAGKPCMADPVYKTIGPDGKVIYTDTPPATGAAQTKTNIPGRASGAEDDPVAAALMIYAKEIVIETGYRFCRDMVPQSSEAVRQARDKWMGDHAALRSKKIEILHDKLSMDELRKIAAQTERENESILRAIREAPSAERQKWCENAPRTFASPDMNLTFRPALTKTIMDYKVKRQDNRREH